MSGGDGASLGRFHHELGEFLLVVKINLRGNTTEVLVHGLGPDGTVEFILGFAQQEDAFHGLGPESGTDSVINIVDNTQDTGKRSRQDGGIAGLVVEGDITAGDGHTAVGAGVSQAVDGFFELPHNGGFFRVTEVQAVGDGDGAGTGGGNVAVGFREG